MDSDDYELAWRLIAEADAERAAKLAVKEFRLYYHEDGTIIGLWERDFPNGDYIVLSHPDEFHRHNTSLLRVNDNKLTLLNPSINETFRLKKSTQGQAVVKGHAVVPLAETEVYTDIEYYDTNN
jgi:hypothetical protein